MAQLVKKKSACSGGNHLQHRRPGLISGSGRSPEEGNGNPLQYSCLGNSMDRGAWHATIHGVARVGQDLEVETPPILSNIVHVVATSLWLQLEIFFIHFLWLSSTPL